MPRRSRSSTPVSILILLAALVVAVPVILHHGGLRRSSMEDIDDWVVYTFAGVLFAASVVAILWSRRRGPGP